MRTATTRRPEMIRAAVAEALEGRRLLTVSFGPAVSYGVGTNPSEVAVADVNADTKPDLIVSNQNSLSISVLLGAGDGTFAAKTDFAVPNNPGSIAAGDLNGDNLPDVVLGIFGGTLQVMLNTGGGSFTTGAGFAMGGATRDVKLADLNNDTKLDAVFSLPDTDVVGVYTGNGDGTFGGLVTLEAGNSPFGLAIADVNADGVQDIAATNQPNDTVSVLRRNANGTLANRTEYKVDNFPWSVAAGDLNGDGKVDLATASAITTSAGGQINVLLNKGDGTFRPGRGFAGGFFTQDVALADVDGDAKLDAIGVNPSDDNVAVLRGSGNGLLATRQQFTVGNQPLKAVVADLNADGKPDVVTADDGGATVSVLINSSTTTGGGNSTGAPDLTATISKTTLPAVFVPGDKGSATVVINNAGDGKATGAVTVTLYASTDTTLDGADLALDTGTALASKAVSLSAGGSKSLTGKFVVAQDFPVGTYFLIASMTTTTAESNTGNNDDASEATFEATHDFGAVGVRKNVKVVRTDGDGTVVTLGLAGPGTGTATFDGDTISLTMDGTSAASKLTVGTKGGNKLTNMGDIVINGPVASVTGKGVNLLGDLTITGGAKTVTLNDVADPHVLTFGGSTPLTLKLNNVTDTTITSTAPIKSLTVLTWSDTDGVADVITAPWVGSATSKGDLDASFVLSGAGATGGVALKTLKATGSLDSLGLGVTGNVGTITVGGDITSRWVANVTGLLKTLTVKGAFAGQVAAGDVGTINVTGDVTSARVLAGANFGANGVFDGTDDTFVGGSIKTIKVGGAVINSVFAGGLDPIDGTLLNGNDTLLLDGSIGLVTVGGAADASSRFLAQSLPTSAKIGGLKVVTETDDRFILQPIN